MRVSKIMSIFWKEYDDILKSRYIMFTMIFLPFFMILILPLSSYLPVLLDPEGLDADELTFLLNFELTSDWSTISAASKYFVLFVELNWLYFFIISIILPSVIAADSFTGEKDRGTVEGLLAAPITETELYVGKITTSLFPTILSIWIYSIPYVVITNIFSNRILGYNYLPNLRFFLIVFLILPLTTVISINLMIWASTRTSTTRDAQQLGGLILLPVMFVLLNIVIVAIAFSDYYILIAGLVLGLVAYLTIQFGIRLLERERWLSHSN